MFAKTSMLKRAQTLFFLFLLAALAWQCSENPANSPPTSEPIDISEAEKTLIESDNKFGLKLFQVINEAQGDSNIFISPLSVAMALGMTLNGADGTTLDAMEQTLELSGLTMEEINESYRHLIDLLTGLDPQVQFDIANSIWYDENLDQPEADFLTRCQEYFGALVTGLDFRSPDAASTINAWVNESTNGKIEEIVKDPIQPDLLMFLINAIYFKGTWTYRFDPELTEEMSFYLADGSTTTCHMMAQRNIYEYRNYEDCEVLNLPYGCGAFMMTIILPHWGTDVNDIIAQITPENLTDWWTGLPSDSIDVYLPKFALEFSMGLKNALTALGMGIAFIPGSADFSNMYPSVAVWIDSVKHKTFVEVNEEGTEAAAVTSVQMGYGGIEGFLADRPFLFMIRENESGTILFIGKITDPTGG